MSRPILIVGAGGHGRETLGIVDALDTEWEFLGFVDDGPGVPERLERLHAEIIGDIDSLRTGWADAAHVIAIGSGGLRRRLDARLSAWGREAVALVHPRATLGADVELGPGVVVAAGAHLTTNVRLGRHVHVNVGAVVSHDCRVGAYSTLSPGVYLNGEVTVGDEVFLGTGAIVTPGCHLGDGARVGAGAVVLGDVPAGVTAVGVPARW